MSKNKFGPATQQLRDHIKATGPDVRAWTTQQRDDYQTLSTAAMREQTRNR